MNTERVSIQELRDKIVRCRLHSNFPEDAQYEVEAWQAAYLWHLGITRELIAAFPQRTNATLPEYLQLSKEHQEGIALIRDKLEQQPPSTAEMNA